MATFIHCLFIYILLICLERDIAKCEKFVEDLHFSNDGDVYHDMTLTTDFNTWCSNSSETSIVCHCDTSSVGYILLQLDAGVKSLSFFITIKARLDMFVFVPPMDLTGLERLVFLEYLMIRVVNAEDVGHTKTKVIFNENSFASLSHLKEIHLNLPTISDKLDEITAPLLKLETLDFSQTQFLASTDVQKALQGVPSLSLNKIILANFQTIGTMGFSEALNLTTFFNASVCEPVIYLDLSYNYLGVIYSGLTQMFPNLKVIDVSYNYLISHDTNNIALELFFHPNLEEFDFSNQGKYLHKHLQPYTGISNNNTFDTKPYIDVGAHSVLWSSRLVTSLVQCINELETRNMSHLFTANHSQCSFLNCAIDAIGYNSKGMVCQDFGGLSDLFDSECIFFLKLPLMKKLKIAKADNLNWNLHLKVHYGIGGHLCLQNRQLQKISFARNKEWVTGIDLSKMIDGIHSVSGSEDINFIDISFNDLDYNTPNSTNQSFPFLQYLNLTGNKIKLNNRSFCDSMTQLKELKLGSNSLSFIYINNVYNCSHLTHLDLSNNSMNVNTFELNLEGTTNLTYIKLDYNNFETLPAGFTNQLDNIQAGVWKEYAQNNVTVSFMKNPLKCLCDAESIKFIKWFQSTKVLIEGKDEYFCTGILGKTFLTKIDIDYLNHHCFHSYTIAILISVFSTMAFVLAILMGYLAYRFRWRIQIRLHKFMSRFSTTNKITVHQDEQQFVYDAFISYCAEDRFWVHDSLMKKLESAEYGFKLCIHYRDFPVGDDIASTIIKSIHSSKHLIIVLSEIALGKPWCQFELQVAIAQAVKRDIRLAVITLGSFKERVEDDTVAWILDNHVFLEWSWHKDAQKLFWAKLLDYMRGESHGYLCCLCGLTAIDHKNVEAFAAGSDGDESQPLLQRC